MISARSSTSTNDTGHSNLFPRPEGVVFSIRHMAHSLDPSILTVGDTSADISNTMHSSSIATVIDTSADDWSSLLSRCDLTMHIGRMATADRHDTDAWSQEQEVRDTELNAVAVSSSLGSNGTIPDTYFLVDVAMCNFPLMELRAERFWTVEHFFNAYRLREDTTARPHDWTSLVASCSGVSPVHLNVNISPCLCENLSQGRRRVGEILVRCGVISVSGMSPIEPPAVGYGHHSGARPVITPGIPSAIAKSTFGKNDEPLITALADWTSGWVHTLVIQPYLRGDFRFRYQGNQSGASASVALRIHRVLSNLENPVQVAIHTLWFISTLTGNGAHDNAPFLSVPIFRYLHNNGAFVAEDFIFRTFVTCAMIGDKTVNDAALSTNIWNRLTRIPQVILNAMEKYALSCLKWDVVMTQIQWHDTIIYLRSCIKMGSAFDPFAYDGTSPSGIMAHYLDELINLSYSDGKYISQREELEILASQPILHFTHREVFDSGEWCPEDDPIITWKSRTIGIAPGVDQNSSTFKVGTTAEDLLDSILGSSNVPNFTHLTQPAGTSFCGSFGVIGAHLAHTVRMENACQNTSWVPSHD